MKIVITGIDIGPLGWDIILIGTPPKHIITHEYDELISSIMLLGPYANDHDGRK